MNAHTYCWDLSPEQGIALQLRVTAPSAVVARRAVRRFLVDHDGAAWNVDCVSRECLHTPLSEPLVQAAGSMRRVDPSASPLANQDGAAQAIRHRGH